jgi:hypothetical protein
LKEEVLDRTCGELAWEEATMFLSHDGLRNDDSKRWLTAIAGTKDLLGIAVF